MTGRFNSAPTSTVIPKVTPAPEALLQRQCACGQHTGSGGECEECKKKHEGTLQRAAVGLSPVHEVPPIVHEVLRSPGQALEADTRAFMEPRFGHDFSSVRVHTDAKAAESARAVNALAYTVGQDVVFGAGQYAPETGTRRQLLAHELAHVLQQAAQHRMPILQRACAPIRFDFAASPIARQIREQLRGITVRPAQSGAAPQPRVDANTVIAILASSNCFLEVARQVQQTYFTGADQPRSGVSPLVIHLHEEPEIGSEFVRGAREHRVEVEVSPSSDRRLSRGARARHRT